MNCLYQNDSQLMMKLKNKLNDKLSDIFLDNYHYSFFENSELHRYNFYIEGLKNKNYNPYDISFNFKIYYENMVDIDSHKNYSDLKYAVIEWANVVPHKTGVGTKITSSFLEELRELNKIKTVYLNPKNYKAEQFWTKNGFNKLDKDKIVGGIEYNMFLTL